VEINISPVTSGEGIPWPTAQRVGGGILTLALLIEFFAPRTGMSQSLAGLSAMATLLAVALWVSSFWPGVRVRIGRLKLRYKVVRRNAGIAALVGFSFVAVRAVSIRIEHPAPVAQASSTVAPPTIPPRAGVPVSPDKSSVPGDAESPEEQLAIIDGATDLSRNNLTVVRFRSLLDQLVETFSGTAQSTADQTVMCQETLEGQGIKESALNIMEGMNQLFTSTNHNQNYPQWLAAYVILREKGMSHDLAIEGLRGLALHWEAD
jgi:hypothetical protein